MAYGSFKITEIIAALDTHLGSDWKLGTAAEVIADLEAAAAVEMTGTLSATTITASVDLITATKTPATAGATGTAGTIAWDADYIYVCSDTDTWLRAAIATW